MFGKKEINLDLRSKPDFIVKSIGKFPVVCWVLVIGAVIDTCLAMPVVRNFLNFTFSLKLTDQWSKILYHIDFYILTAVFVVSGIGLLVNSTRHRRRTDEYNTSLIYFLVLSAICMAGYLIFFRGL
jgi:hypothetical protein